jgi:hypothetical protein
MGALRFWDGRAWTGWTVRSRRTGPDSVVWIVLAMVAAAWAAFVIGIMSTAVQSCSQGDAGAACDRSGYSATAFFLGVSAAICAAGPIVSLAAVYRSRRRGAGRSALYGLTATPLLVLGLALWAVWSAVQRNGTWDLTPVNPDVLARSLSVGALVGIPLGVAGGGLVLRLRAGTASHRPTA